MKERSRSRVGWLLLVLLALVAGPGLIQKACPRSTDGRPVRPTPDERSCAVEVGGHRYLAYDMDDDARVDCFFAVGLMRAGFVDCIRSSSAGRILVTFEGGRCEAGDEWTEAGDLEQQDAWNEILRHEKRINAIVAGSGD